MPCMDCGRPGVRSRCDACARGRSRARGTTTQRGYGSTHRRLREEWRPLVEAGEVRCARCDEYILPDEEWDLGHSDNRMEYNGPEHSRVCNRAEAGRKAHLNR
ncbi:hypothetical protein GCM10027067_26510 [Pseudactinotalea suaedae]